MGDDRQSSVFHKMISNAAYMKRYQPALAPNFVSISKGAGLFELQSEKPKKPLNCYVEKEKSPSQRKGQIVWLLQSFKVVRNESATP